MGTSQSRAEEFKQNLEEKYLKRLYPLPSAKVVKVKSRKPTKTSSLKRIERVTLYAQPMGKNENVVNARDGRLQVHNTAEWPNSAHGLLTMNFKNKTCWGTGIMIGANIVLTAAHNLYDSEDKIYADLKSMKFLPGVNGDVAPFGSVEVEQYFVSPNYIEKEKEDYGLVILKKPIGERTGYFGLACLEPEEIREKRINIVGYPYDKVVSRPCVYEMWGMEGTATNIDQDQGTLNYMIDTYGGQSGSGVWYQEREDYYICGVHVSGTQLVNTATLLTRVMYEQIHTWLQQVSFNEKLFELRDDQKLDFYQKGINAECVSVLMRYSLDNLTSLKLDQNQIGDEGAKILSRNTSWVNLTQLNLQRNNIGPEGAKELAKNTSCTSLLQLNLSDNRIGPKGAKELAKNTSWTSLSQLDLSWNNIGPQGAKELAKNTSWTSLSQLDLSLNDIGPEGAKELAKNTSWTSLSQLDLSYNNIGPEGANELTKNTSWTSLSQLDLSWNNIGPQGAKELAKNTSWTSLSQLDLSLNDIGPEGAKELAKNTSWTSLSQLDLSYNNIGPEGANELTKNTSWTSLSQLDLSWNNIGPQGAKELAKNTSWTSLSQLDLSLNDIGPEGAKELAKNTSWTSLSRLVLSSNKIGSEGVELLRKNQTWKKKIQIIL